ncbi:MAG: hypothetical protein J1F18_01130 [Lachnospiraceae bacterium]|nr:hypothetical protein [Lachnospiraceae bacterium]
MKLLRRISLFLILSGIMLGLGGYSALKAEQFFYPNRYARKETPNYVVQHSSESGEMQEQVIEAAVGGIPVVTADTLYLIEEVNLADGTVHETEESMPVKYIGLDREGLLAELDIYDSSPPLSELERGFETIELTAFSKDRVVVCKYYKIDKEDEQEQDLGPGFYLMVADHFIVVYREDKKTLYISTDILLESLDDTLQAEIIQGKYVETEEEVYNFLESYSS